MRDVLGKLGWFAAGALALYYLDPQAGAQRRRLLVELLRSGGDPRPGQPRRRSVYGQVPVADARSDAQLRDRIQQRLGRMVSHPRALHVQVENGVVRLSGDVLAKERDGLLEQVREMEGVQKLVNAMSAHDSLAGIASDETRREEQLAG